MVAEAQGEGYGAAGQVGQEEKMEAFQRNYVQRMTTFAGEVLKVLRELNDRSYSPGRLFINGDHHRPKAIITIPSEQLHKEKFAKEILSFVRLLESEGRKVHRHFSISFIDDGTPLNESALKADGYDLSLPLDGRLAIE